MLVNGLTALGLLILAGAVVLAVVLLVAFVVSTLR